MPTPSHNSSAVYSQDLEDSSVDQQFKFALKNMLPVPSNSEQQIILDEYNLQLSQFSIAINRIIKEVPYNLVIKQIYFFVDEIG